MSDRKPMPFVQVLTYLEEHGWDFTHIKKPFRIFTKRGRSPIFFKVENNLVEQADVQRIQRAVAEDRKKGP